MSRWHQQEKRYSSPRDLATEANIMVNAKATKRRSSKKTLFFASSSSIHMPLSDGEHVAHAGLYKCTFDSNVANSESTKNRSGLRGELAPDVAEQQEPHPCGEARKVANGFNRDGRPYAELSLYNLQFHNGFHETTRGAITATAAPSSYLYANSHIKNRREHPDSHVDSWEILRAKLPATPDENAVSQELMFQSVFRTFEVFDWNECNFRCCPYDGSVDDDPFAYSTDEENGYYAHTHAYVRTVPRSSAVDESTGDVFVSWEGFYANCDPANSNRGEGKKLEWTIGVSRLKTEDPYCTTDQFQVMENNFARCTEPVAIAFQSSKGREVVLPHGGFAVLPASKNPKHSRRSFLLSTLQSPITEERRHTTDLTSHVWGFSEGGIPNGNGGLEDHQHLTISGNGTVVDGIFLDANTKDGGTLRTHTNPTTGRPDHLCRTIFNIGIGCMPISVTTEQDGIVRVQPEGEEQIVLTKAQVASFCKLQDAEKSKFINYERQTTLVTGLDVIWSDDPTDGNGSPETIVFGCFGSEGGHGNFGSIVVGKKNQQGRPVQVLNGAFPGAVHFVPGELEEFVLPSPSPDESESTLLLSSSSLFARVTSKLCTGYSSLFVFILSIAIFAKRKWGKRYRHPPNSYSSENGLSPKIFNDSAYFELPRMDSSASLRDLLTNTDSSASIKTME